MADNPYDQFGTAAANPYDVFDGSKSTPSGPTAKPTNGAAINDSEKPLVLSDAKHPLMYMGHEIGSAVEDSWNQLKSDFQAATKIPKDFNKQSFWDQQKDQFKSFVATGKEPIDAFNLVVSPITGAFHGAVVKPAATALSYLNPRELTPRGSRPETQSELENDVNKMLLGVAPEFGDGASIAEVLKKSAPAPKPVTTYEQAVKQLKDEGVDLTLGQMHGGQVRREEEASKSNRYIGPAIRNAENNAITSFNKATYNRVLAPIGEKYTGDAIGREGVKAVGDIISKKYDALTPKLRLAPDDKLLSDVAELRESAASDMPPAQAKQFESIINNRVLSRLNTSGELDGKTFKQIESELTHLSRLYSPSGDAAQRQLGQSVNSLMGALRDNLERTSDPSVRADLKKLNGSWAALTRLEGAAANRAGTGGVFTTGDLLTAVKGGDKSARRRAFARGDALLQDFAERAGMVLPNRLPDSGTTERLLQGTKGLIGAGIGGTIGGLPGAAIGGAIDLAAPMATNPAATKIMSVLKAKKAAKLDARIPDITNQITSPGF